MLTVLMATHNGGSALSRVFDGYLALEAPAGGWRLLVVANACTDDTCAIVKRYAQRLPILLLEEPERGKNRALNTGLEHVEGDLVVLTDDDTVPQPDWLVEMRRGVDLYQDFDIFGGRINALWPWQPPKWFFSVVPLGSTYAVTPEDLQDGPVSPRMVWGPNMAVRRSVFEVGHRFDASIGPQAGHYRMGSETEFTTRMAQHGFRSYHLGKARVGHVIRPHQMETGWIVRRAYRHGRGQARIDREESRDPTLLAVPRWMIKKALKNYLRWPVGIFTGNMEKAFSARWQLHFFFGYCFEAYASGRQSRRSK